MDFSAFLSALSPELQKKASDLASKVVEGFSNVDVNVLSGNNIEVNVFTDINVGVAVEADDNVDTNTTGNDDFVV